MPLHQFPNELRLVRVVVAAVLLAAFGQAAHADELIDVVVRTTDSSPITINGTGSHIVDLTSDVANDRGSFAPLAGRPFTATFNVGGVRNLLQMTSDSTGTMISLRDPQTGRIQDFIDATKAKVQAKIRSFLEQNLNSLFVGYQQRLNGGSGIGITDGNPLAATAFLATDAFNRFGIHPAVPAAPIGEIGHFAFGFDAGGGEFRTSSLDGDFAAFDINLSGRFNQLVGMVISVPILYRSIRNTDSYAGGVNLGLPFTILTHPADKDGFSWQLTPWGVAGGGINESLASGGGIAGGGVTSSLAYRLGNFTFTMANQAGYDGGFQFPYDDFTFDTPVDQWIIKDGVYTAYTMSHGLFLDGGASYTNFVHDAGVSSYVTPQMGAGIRWGRGGAYEARLSYVGDFGNGFNDNGIQGQFHFSF